MAHHPPRFSDRDPTDANRILAQCPVATPAFRGGFSGPTVGGSATFAGNVCRTAGAVGCIGEAGEEAGRMTDTDVPTSTVLSISSRPPCNSTKILVRGNPSPVPP